MRACRLSAVAVACVALAGCQGTQQRARQEATQRWNRARSEVKARLAADQLESGNASGAAGELSEAYRLDPDNPALVPLRVRVWLAQGETASAAELLDTTAGSSARRPSWSICWESCVSSSSSGVMPLRPTCGLPTSMAETWST